MNALSTAYQDPVLRNLQQQRQLPNGGGSYSVGEGFGGGGGESWGDKDAGFLNSGAQAPVQTQAPAQTQPPRNKYINPKTGDYYTPEEYANSVAMKIPASKGTGDIGQYAGDAMTNPDESAADLTKRATNMNNTRNDIATGTTDPYKAGKDSGVAYSPQELAAIEKAYAGIYDPALNDVFGRLKEREDSRKRLEDREDKIFATNESIRQWRATTGTKATAGGEDGDIEKYFTDTQLHKGSTAAAMDINDFKLLDPDLANFYINPPMGKNGDDKLVPVYENFREDLKAIEDGSLTWETLRDEILAAPYTPAVKTYLIQQIPTTVTEEEKEGWLQWIWSRMPGVD